MVKVIIVDDIFNTRGVLRTFLQDNGFNVIGDFEDGLDALESFRDNKADLAILDYNLNCTKNSESYTGIDLMNDLKKIKPDLKVVFVSANAESSIIKKAIIKGASDFIVKPFNLEDVLNRISKVLKGK